MGRDLELCFATRSSERVTLSGIGLRWNGYAPDAPHRSRLGRPDLNLDRSEEHLYLDGAALRAGGDRHARLTGGLADAAHRELLVFIDYSWR